MNRIRKILPPLLLLAALASGMFWAKRSPPGNLSEQKLRLRIAVTASEGTALIRIAHRLGFFVDEQMEIELIEETLSSAAFDRMWAGDADFAAVGERPVIEQSLKDLPFSIFATLYSTRTNDKILGRLDRGISVPKDLVGKRVGTIKGGSHEYFLASFAWHFGIDPTQLQIVELVPDAVVGAISRGEVDAVATRDAWVGKGARALGKRAVIFSEREAYANTVNLVGRSGSMDPPELRKRLLRSLLRAEEFLRRYPQRAKVILTRELGMERNYLDSIWDDCEFGLRLDQELVVTLEEKARWLLQSGKVNFRDLPNYLHHIDYGPLLELRPSAVGIIH